VAELRRERTSLGTVLSTYGRAPEGTDRRLTDRVDRLFENP